MDPKMFYEEIAKRYRILCSLKEGETIMVSTGDIVDHSQWSTSFGRWWMSEDRIKTIDWIEEFIDLSIQYHLRFWDAQVMIWMTSSTTNIEILRDTTYRGDKVIEDRITLIIGKICNYVVPNAAREGSKEILEMILYFGRINTHKPCLCLSDYTYHDWAMMMTAGEGHIDIVQMMLDRGATNYNDTMKKAAEGGHIKIVEMMLKKGADKYNDSIEAAIQGKHQEITELIYQTAEEREVLLCKEMLFSY